MPASGINIHEIHSQLRREYNSLMDLEIPRLVNKYNERREGLKIKEYVTFANAYPVRSMAGNNWIIFIQKSPLVKNTLAKNASAYWQLLITIVRKGSGLFTWEKIM